MGEVSQYLNWLRHHQCRTGIVNSYWFVEFISRVNALLKKEKMNACPHVLIENELEEEEKSQSESPILRKFLIQILSMALKEEISDVNYHVKLMILLNKPGLLPGEIESLFSTDKEFHLFPSEVKLYVYCILWQLIDGKLRTTNKIGSDTAGNSFYLVDGGRLYVEYGDQLKRMAQNRILRNPWERYFSTIRWKLIAETDKKWRNTALIMKSFDQAEIAAEILETLKKVTDDDLEVRDEDITLFHDQMETLRIRSTPVKDKARKCLRDSFCSNEECSLNHYEQYHPITTKFENIHLEYAKQIELSGILEELSIRYEWDGKG